MTVFTVSPFDLANAHEAYAAGLICSDVLANWLELCQEPAEALLRIDNLAHHLQQPRGIGGEGISSERVEDPAAPPGFTELRSLDVELAEQVQDFIYRRSSPIC